MARDAARHSVPLRPPDPGEGARAVAWLALRMSEAPEAGGAQETLASLADAANLEARDRALAFEMLQGVLRRRLALDAALAGLEGFENAIAQPDLQDLLRLGAFQHFCLDRVPTHALVHATVEVARRRLGKTQAGFLNAALQRLVRQYPRRAADFEKLIARLTPEARHSMPGWIARTVRRIVGSEGLEAALEALNRPLPIYGRARDPVATARRLAEEAGLAAAPRPDLAPDCIAITATATAIATSAAFREGALTLQDASAQLVAALADARPAMTVVDYCAAPGGKTTAMAEAMEGSGRLIACDVSAERLGRLRENAQRLGLADRMEVRRIAQAPNAIFALRTELHAGAGADRVLVDAPCSGLGTLRRHPEIRWRVRRADLERLAALQGEILDSAALLVRPGGRLIYATCSFAPEENEGVIDTFLQKQAGRFRVLTLADAPLHDFLARRIDATGWLRIAPGAEEMDAPSAVRLERLHA